MDDNEQQILKSWDVNASAWTKSIRTNQIKSREIATNKTIVDALIAHKPKNVLDVGCGEGWLVRELIKNGIAATGIDGSASLIKDAQEMKMGTFYVIKYEELDSSGVLSNDKYDAIVCNFALISQSIDNLLKALKNLLAKEGKLFIQTVHPFSCGEKEVYKDDWRTETFSNFGTDYKEPQPWYFRTFGSWIDTLGKNGFKIIECREPLNPATGRPLSVLFVCES